MYVNEHVRDILNRAKNLNGTSLAKGKKKNIQTNKQTTATATTTATTTSKNQKKRTTHRRQQQQQQRQRQKKYKRTIEGLCAKRANIWFGLIFIFGRIELIFGRLTCLDMKRIVL